jgi:hypothetical protein
MILGYIDPGQGMLIWQAIVSAFVGVLFYLKKTRQFIAGVFGKIFGRGQAERSDAAVLSSEIPAIKAETKAEVH